MKIFLLIGIIVTSNFAIANSSESNCYIKSYYGVKHPLYGKDELESEYRPLSAIDAKDCFEMAVTFAEFTNDPFNINIKINDSGMPGPILNGTLYYTWEFNDGILDDSDGKVTKYTEECMTEVEEENFLGDKRYKNVLCEKLSTFW